MMNRKSHIHVKVELDEDNIPEKISWDASEKPTDIPSTTKAVSLSLWDDSTMNAMRMDLWTKEMTIEEMKRFFVNCLGGLAQTILNSTGDEYLANETNALCDKFVQYISESEENNTPEEPK